MRRALAILTVLLGLQTLSGCGVLVGAVIGGGAGAVAGHTVAGIAIGAGVGAIVDDDD
jgi:hypothetical protein